MHGKGEQKEEKKEQMERGIKVSVNCGWSVLLSEQALCLMTAIFPIFFLYPYFPFVS